MNRPLPNTRGYRSAEVVASEGKNGPDSNFRERAIEVQQRLGLPEAWKPCQECGGTGVDPGSLNEPEACKVCLGSKLAQPEGE